MKTTTKKDLIDRIAAGTVTRQTLVKTVLQHFLDEITCELTKGNRLEFRDFGVFEAKLRAPRQAQNPKTMAKVRVPARRTVKFKVGRVMKMRMREMQAQVDEATGLALEPSAERRSSRVGARGRNVSRKA